jgi:hypothetical protein
MSRRITTRLPDGLYQCLVATAVTRSITPSDVLREALECVLVDEHAPRSVVSIATPHDLEVCALSLLSRLPPRVPGRHPGEGAPPRAAARPHGDGVNYHGSRAH